MAVITKPFAWLMLWLYDLTGNYGAAVILFALAVNLILLPFMAKSKKGMMKMSRVQPKIQELQNHYGKDPNNQQKLQKEMQKLYQEEGVNPASGCIWSLIPFPILIALYAVIRQPLQKMMFVGEEVVEALETIFASDVAGLSTRAQAYIEINLTNLLHNNWDSTVAQLTAQGLDISRLRDIDFSFLGMNLGDQPDWQLLWKGPSDGQTWLAAALLFAIPFLSAFLSWASMKISSATNPQQASGANNAQTEATMKSMNLMMPLMSVWICFIMPAAMGVYWIANSVFGIIRDFALTKIYKAKLDKEDEERKANRSEYEKQQEEKRLEAERRKAEGVSEENTSLSKKKQAAQAKQQDVERKAAIAKAEREARREQLGVVLPDKPASQVGNRRYARGRAYVEDRFTNPEAAAEETAIAAEASEGASSIDETVAEETPAAVETKAEEAPAAETAAAEEAPAAETAAEEVSGDAKE